MDYAESIQRTLDYIEENLSELITLDKAAEVACFSPFHFHRVFQAMVGEPLMNYALPPYSPRGVIFSRSGFQNRILNIVVQSISSYMTKGVTDQRI